MCVSYLPGDVGLVEEVDLTVELGRQLFESHNLGLRASVGFDFGVGTSGPFGSLSSPTLNLKIWRRGGWMWRGRRLG